MHRTLKSSIIWFLILIPRHAKNNDIPFMCPSDITGQSLANREEPNHTCTQSLTVTLLIWPWHRDKHKNK